MIHDVIFAVWFLLPAAAANVTPIIISKLPLLRNWQTALDFGKTYHGQEIFGKNKSWRGLVFGILVATLIFGLQQYLVRHTNWGHHLVEQTDYNNLPTLVLGPLFGLGALGGDAIESFFKRRRNIASGHAWLGFDQLDYIIGSVLVSLPFIILSLRQYLLIFGFWFVAHLLASFLGFKLGFKARPI